MFLYEISTAKVTTEEAADTLSTELRVSNCYGSVLGRRYSVLRSIAPVALLGKASSGPYPEFRPI